MAQNSASSCLAPLGDGFTTQRIASSGTSRAGNLVGLADSTIQFIVQGQEELG
jgi:hypothetical protein